MSKPRKQNEPSPQLLREQHIDDLRAGLAFGCLHDLPHEEAQHGFLSPTILLQLLGIGDENFVDDLLERRRVGGLPRAAFFFIDSRKIFAALEAQIVKILEHFSRYFSWLDQIS